MNKVIYILLLCFLFSCKEEEKLPDYLWSEEKFTEVLTEFQQTEAMVRLGYHRKSDSLIVNDSIYNASFRTMNITQADFDSNYSYYLKRPKELEKIYDEVISRLSIKSAELKESK